MNRLNAPMASLDAFVDVLATMTRPNYVDITDTVQLGPLAEVIDRLVDPLVVASRRVRSMDPSSRCLAFLDCGEFDNLIADYDDPVLAPQRILLYIVREGEFLPISGEAYLRNITAQFRLTSGVNLTFACFRDLDALNRSWEFIAGYYLWDGSPE